MICQQCGMHKAEWWDDIRAIAMCEDCALRAADGKWEDMGVDEKCEKVGFEWMGDEDD